jgi:hypothetical protein
MNQNTLYTFLQNVVVPGSGPAPRSGDTTSWTSRHIPHGSEKVSAARYKYHLESPAVSRDGRQSCITTARAATGPRLGICEDTKSFTRLGYRFGFKDSGNGNRHNCQVLRRYRTPALYGIKSQLSPPVLLPQSPPPELQP